MTSTKDTLTSIEELKNGSRLSLILIVVGALFLGGTVYYSAARLAPLEKKEKLLHEKATQLQGQIEDKEKKLLILNASVNNNIKPISHPIDKIDGWVYLGRVSTSGEWVPLSHGVESATNPAKVIIGSHITIRENTSLAGNPVDSSTATGDLKSNKNKYFIKPGTKLEILDLISEKSSIGDAKFLWAKVSTSSEFMLQVGL